MLKPASKDPTDDSGFPVRRTPHGTIDYNFYRARAKAERKAAIAGALTIGVRAMTATTRSIASWRPSVIAEKKRSAHIT